MLICGFAFADTYKSGKKTIKISAKDPLPTVQIPIAGQGYRTIHILGHNTDVDAAASEEIWENGGNLTYLSAAETMNIVSTDTKDTDFAVGILTFGANIADTKTVTIGSKIYTFQDTLTDVDGNVFIGTLATDSLDNLIAAITLTGTPGTDYALSMTEHPNVTAAAGAGDTMDATSEIGNNEAATTETDDNASWADITLINGVGLRSIRVDGVDNNYNEISEVVSLDGTTNAITTLAFLRINHLIGQRVGSEADNAGVITATASSASTIQATINTGDGINHDYHFTVPKNKIAYIINTYFEALSVASNTVLIFEFRVRGRNGSWLILSDHTIDIDLSNAISIIPIIAKIINSQSDIVMQVSTTLDNAEIFVESTLILIDK